MAERIDDEANEAQARLACAAGWLLELARAVRVARLHGPQSPYAREQREHLAGTLAAHLERFGEWSFVVTASGLFLDVEALVRTAKRSGADASPPMSPLEALHDLLFRDGVRRIAFLPGISARDIDALVDALRDAACEQGHAEDLVTALWQANPTHLVLETAPFEPAPRLAPGSASELDVEEECPGSFADPAAAYAELTLAASAVARVARRGLLEAWERERAAERLEVAGRLMARLIAVADEPGTRATLARYAMTGVSESIAHTAWDEACRTLELAQRFDADGSLTAQARIDAVRSAPPEDDLGESLDQAREDDLERCFELALGLGHAAVPLVLAALAGARREATRAAACRTLATLCASDPFALEAAVGDPRVQVATGVVSVLGRIGGSGLSPLLARAAGNPDPAVQLEVVRALAALPAPQRAPLLAGPLASPDTALCGEALRIAGLDPEPSVARRLLGLIEDPAFEQRPEDIRQAFFEAVAGSGDDAVVPALDRMLTSGGWFARPTWQRSAAADALARLGTHAARKALERGLKHASEAVRTACSEAQERRAA